jgi:imidazoleglycerol-phosphate dehydratase
MPRIAKIDRSTRETQIKLELNLDGGGTFAGKTGVGFFDHMLELLARHGALDLTVEAQGDLHVDQHHTVEDVGICLGQAVKQALGDKAGIRRYGWCLLPMDEALVRAALDLSGRPYLVWNVDFPSAKIGSFDTELVREFFTAVAMNGGITLNVARLDGANSHHIAEAAFKAVAQALRAAVEPDPRAGSAVPSTKGTLGG